MLFAFVMGCLLMFFLSGFACGYYTRLGNEWRDARKSWEKALALQVDLNLTIARARAAEQRFENTATLLSARNEHSTYMN